MISCKFATLLPYFIKIKSRTKLKNRRRLDGGKKFIFIWNFKTKLIPMKLKKNGGMHIPKEKILELLNWLLILILKCVNNNL